MFTGLHDVIQRHAGVHMIKRMSIVKICDDKTGLVCNPIRYKQVR